MVYEYTKPRAPIAAEYRSPGPCYQLPSLVGYNGHDKRSTHNVNPAYGFGIYHGKFSDDCSPGPVYYPDMKVTKQGKDGTPHYSLYGKAQELSLFKPPGPGAYSPEKAGPSANPTAPVFSFGSRTRLRKSDQNPAPNSYSLPSLMGKTVEANKKQSPIFSQRGRATIGSFSEDLQKTPGPGTYSTVDPNNNKRKGPSYSMLGRNMMPGDNTKKPGPGAHSPEKVTVNKNKAPQYGFGIGHSQFTTPLILAEDMA